MFLLAPLVMLVLEVLAFVEVGRAIGWLLAVVLLAGTSVVGAQLLRIQGRAAVERVSLAVAQHRAPGRAALDGVLGFVGSFLLVVPGFITDAIGALLLLPPTRALTRRWLSRHYAGRAMSFVTMTGRFAPRGRTPPPADVESWALDDDADQLER